MSGTRRAGKSPLTKAPLFVQSACHYSLSMGDEVALACRRTGRLSVMSSETENGLIPD